MSFRERFKDAVAQADAALTAAMEKNPGLYNENPEGPAGPFFIAKFVGAFFGLSAAWNSAVLDHPKAYTDLTLLNRTGVFCTEVVRHAFGKK